METTIWILVIAAGIFGLLNLFAWAFFKKKAKKKKDNPKV